MMPIDDNREKQQHIAVFLG